MLSFLIDGNKLALTFIIIQSACTVYCNKVCCKLKPKLNRIQIQLTFMYKKAKHSLIINATNF